MCIAIAFLPADHVERMFEEMVKEASRDLWPVLEGEILGKQWSIIEEIGEGSFGAVYKAKSIESGIEVAVKVEHTESHQKSLEVDVVLLSKLNGSKHTCTLYGYGTVRGLHYLVMGLTGRTLAEIKHGRQGKIFSCNTSLRVAIQCVEAIEEVHSVGYLHRDVKPDNLAIDVNEATARTIYLLDFGMARRYVTLSGQIRKARRNPGFRGTSLYSSVAANKGKETGRVDDLWSVMYSVIECIRGALPWDHIRERDILNMKIRMPTQLLLENVPGKLAYILNYLKTMKREEQPRYGWIISILETIMQERKYRSGDPFDWQVPFLEQEKSSLN
uniref:Protein kinase domain-containing protein n=1 Tax=Trichuris muris TaxID=70415 RepID=A0A5S6QQG6_TRIMR